jgi:hypothetical protein
MPRRPSCQAAERMQTWYIRHAAVLLPSETRVICDKVSTGSAD